MPVATVSQLEGQVRRYLRFPKREMLDKGMILETAFNKIQYYQNELALTDQIWFLERTQIDVASGTDEYIASVGNWGRAVLAQKIDPSNPDFVPREIDIVDFQDIERYNRQSGVVYSTAGHNARAVAQIRRAGLIWLIFAPKPQASASYQFYYEPDGVIPGSEGDNVPFLTNFLTLIVLDTAISHIIDCEWDGKSGEYNERMRAGLEATLARDYDTYRVQFDNYKYQDRQEGVNLKRSAVEDWDAEHDSFSL